MLAGEYTDVTVLSIAGNGRDMSFSSDTGMAECLVVARQAQSVDEPPDGAVRFISLSRRPKGFAHASSMVRKRSCQRSA